MAASVTIRQSLLRNLVLVILLLGCGVFATTFWGARRAVRSLSRSLMSQKIDETEQRLRRFFDPVERELRIAREWAEAGLLDTESPTKARQLLEPLLERTPQVSSVMVADERGREVMIMRVGDAWSIRQTRRDEWGTRTLWHSWRTGERGTPEEWREVDYDPRRRPWFEGAVALRPQGAAGPATVEERVHWTVPYEFFTSKDPGLTASMAYDDQDGITQVVGFDMLLTDISAFTTRMRVSDRGGAIVLTDDGRVIGLPRDERYLSPRDRAGLYLKTPKELGWALTGDAANAFAVRPLDSEEAERFASSGQQWWGQGRQLRLSDERSLWIGVIVPESDLLGNIPALRIWIIGFTVAVLAVAIARAVMLARRYSTPIEQLVSDSDRMSRGDLEPGPPIASNIEEVGRLAHAHERMRDGLRSLMKMERDLQVARQIQQSTLPKALPTLPGFEIAAWSEPAEETGGDSFDVIGVKEGPPGPDGLPQREIDPPGGADRVAILLADATGHGIGPALSVTQIRAMIRMAVRTSTDLGRLVRALNEQLHADLPAGRFITAYLGVIDSRDATLLGFSAGQGPLLLYRAESRSCVELEVDECPFGIVPDMRIEPNEPIALDIGDVLAVFSDGIYEAMDPEDGQFGSDRVQALIAAHHGRSAEEILASLRQELETFTRGRPADDDRTAILVRCVGS